MSAALERWVRLPLAEGLGWALFHSLWQGAVIALGLAAAVGIFRPSSPRVRYALACLALGAFPLVFGVTLALSMPSESAGVGALLGEAPVTDLSAPRAWAAGSFTVALWDRLGERLPWMVPFWMAGLLVLYGRTLGGWIAAQRLRKKAVRPAPAGWQERLERLAGRLRLSRPVHLVESWLVEAPAVIGLLRPVVLVPVGAVTGLAPQQLEALLAHELAHIRRLDGLVNMLQKLVEGMLFYHPAVWWVSGVVRAERENCCDDVAVSICGDPHGYATALAALEQQRGLASAATLAATGGTLMQRIRRLLHRSEGPRPAIAPAPVVALMVMLAGVALAAWQPQALPAPPAPAAQVAPAAQPALVPRPLATGPAQPPAQAAQPATPAQPAPPVPPRRGDGFAIFFPDDTYMSGWFNNHDREQARRYGKATEFIWLRREGSTYIVRDAESVRRAREIFREGLEEHRQMAALQSQLLQQQLRSRLATTAELGAEMERVKAFLGALQQRELKREDLAGLEAELMQLQIKLQELRAQVAELRLLSAAQHEELARQQTELESERRSFERMNRIWQLLDEAIRKGRAEPILQP